MEFVYNEEKLYYLDYSLKARKKYEELLRNNFSTIYWEGIITPCEKEGYYFVEDLLIPPQENGELLSEEYSKWQKDNPDINLFGKGITGEINEEVFNNLKNEKLTFYDTMNVGDCMARHIQNTENLPASIICIKTDENTITIYQAIRFSSELDRMIEEYMKINGLI